MFVADAGLGSAGRRQGQRQAAGRRRKSAADGVSGRRRQAAGRRRRRGQRETAGGRRGQQEAAGGLTGCRGRRGGCLCRYDANRAKQIAISKSHDTNHIKQNRTTPKQLTNNHLAESSCGGLAAG